MLNFITCLTRSNYISLNQIHPLRNPQSKQGLVNFITCLTRSNYFSFNQAHPLRYSQMKQEYAFFHYLSCKVELLQVYSNTPFTISHFFPIYYFTIKCQKCVMVNIVEKYLLFKFLTLRLRKEISTRANFYRKKIKINCMFLAKY